MSSRTIFFALLATAFSTPIDIDNVGLRMISGEPCLPCNPQGATGTNPPDVGTELKSMYLDVLGSVKDIHFRKRWEDSVSEKRDETFCCRESLDCVNVLNLNIPMCYDKFTTNYAFPDGTWGSLTTGEYNDQDGSKADLFTGDFTKANGETGNIYSGDEAAKPNTATLSIPPQWTGTGVGSAIPATEIASYVVATPTAPAVTTTADSASPSSATNAEAQSPTSTSSTGAAEPVAMAPGFALSLITAIMYAIHAL